MSICMDIPRLANIYTYTYTYIHTQALTCVLINSSSATEG